MTTTKVVLKTVRYTEHMTEKAREVVDKFNGYAEKISGALDDHLCLVPYTYDTEWAAFSVEEVLEHLLEEGYYEYTSENPYFGELKQVLDDLGNAARPYHNSPWEDDVMEVYTD